MLVRRLALGAIIALVAACSISAAPEPGSADSEAVARTDAPSDGRDAAGPSKGPSDEDPDATPPGDILGKLTGSCGIVRTQLGSAISTLEQNTLTFVAGEAYERESLSPGGQRLFDTPNAGGSSTESEVMSFEILRACEGASLVKTETEIAYGDDTPGAPTITDILVEIGGQKVGVSVARAYRPQNLAFPDADVKALIQKKLEGVNRSSERVRPEDRWVKQILHVFAANQAQADAVVRVLPTIDASVRANTIVLLTQTTGGGFVYCNPDPPLGSECP